MQPRSPVATFGNACPGWRGEIGEGEGVNWSWRHWDPRYLRDERLQFAPFGATKQSQANKRKEYAPALALGDP